MEIKPDIDWCYLRSRLLPATEDAVIITRNEETFVHKVNAGDDALVPRKGSVDVSIQRFHRETNLWDPKATSDSEEISAAYENLFAAAAMYPTVVEACTISVQDSSEGIRKREKRRKRDRGMANDHDDLDSRELSSPFLLSSIVATSGQPNHANTKVG